MGRSNDKGGSWKEIQTGEEKTVKKINISGGKRERRELE